MSICMGRKTKGPDWKGALMILVVMGLFFLIPAMCAYLEIP